MVTPRKPSLKNLQQDFPELVDLSTFEMGNRQMVPHKLGGWVQRSTLVAVLDRIRTRLINEASQTPSHDSYLQGRSDLQHVVDHHLKAIREALDAPNLTLADVAGTIKAQLDGEPKQSGQPKGAYPFVIPDEPQITQFDEHKFVWHDHDGHARGATTSLQSARIELKRWRQREAQPRTRITIEPGYERLGHVLQAAHDQSALAKGKERHANNLPFDQQRMQQISQMLNSPHGMSYQACKKITEGLEMSDLHSTVKELLGAIVYTAGIIIYLQGKTSDPAGLLGPREQWSGNIIQSGLYGQLGTSDKPMWKCSQCGTRDRANHHEDCISVEGF